MARKPNKVKTVKLTVSTTAAVTSHLDELVLTGLYGKSPSEAAERLIAQGVQQLLSDGGILSHLRETRKDTK